MRKNILIFGSLSGLIVSIMIAFTVVQCYNNPDFSGSMLVGYTFMLVAFSFVFVGIKNYRDKFNDGLITFGKAFKIGILITLVASTIYVVVWLFSYYLFIPDYMDKYAAHTLRDAKASGKSAAEIVNIVKETNNFKELYKSPIMVILFTYLEIFPVGLIITLISSFILMRKKDEKLEVA